MIRKLFTLFFTINFHFIAHANIYAFGLTDYSSFDHLYLAKLDTTSNLLKDSRTDLQNYQKMSPNNQQ